METWSVEARFYNGFRQETSGAKAKAKELNHRDLAKFRPPSTEEGRDEKPAKSFAVSHCAVTGCRELPQRFFIIGPFAGCFALPDYLKQVSW